MSCPPSLSLGCLVAERGSHPAPQGRPPCLTRLRVCRQACPPWASVASPSSPEALPSLSRWDFTMPGGGREHLAVRRRCLSQSLRGRAGGGRWCQLVTGVASPRRQLLGGPGWEGRLPHVPTAEGQEDGRPPAAPLCLLQQDRAFRGESPRRPEVAPSAHPLGGVFRGASGGIHSRAGRDLLMTQDRPLTGWSQLSSSPRGQRELGKGGLQVGCH